MILTTEIDLILTTQFAVAWAGEDGEEKRLGWWQTDLVSEFGGQDLLKRMLPSTWEWAVFQACREAARRCDAELRSRDHDPDRILSLFNLHFAVDERVDERLLELKRSGKPLREALPGLNDVLTDGWQPERFEEWVRAHGKVECVQAPIGRRLRGEPPQSLEILIRQLIAATWPISSEYSLPHYQRTA